MPKKKRGPGRPPKVERSFDTVPRYEDTRDNETRCGIWWDRILRAKKYAEPFHKIYARNLAWYRGSQIMNFDEDGFPSLDGIELEEGSIVINRVLPSLATQRANVMFQVPWAKLRPRQILGQDGTMRTQVCEYALNYVLRAPQNEMKEQLRLFVLSTFLAYGAIKATYTPEERTPEEPPERVGHLEETSDQSFEVVGGIPMMTKDGALIRKNGGFQLEDFLPGELFSMEWVDWRDLLHDPEGGPKFRDHAWVAQRRIWRLDEFKRDPLWTHKENIEAAAKHVDDVTERDKDAIHRMVARGRARQNDPFPDDNEDDSMRLYGWEIWDFKAKKVEILIEDHPYLVSQADNDIPAWVDHSPYEFAMFHRIPGEWFPLTEVEAFIPTNESYNRLRGMRMRHTNRFNRKYEVMQGDIDDDNMEFLKNGPDGQVIQTKTGKSIAPIIDAPMDPSIYTDMELDIRDGSEILGSTPESRGTPQADSATQAAIINSRASARELDKKLIISEALARIADKMLDCLQANLDRQMAVAIAGPDGVQWEQVVTRADIQGDFEASVEINELGPPDSGIRLARLNQAITVMGPTVFQEPLFVERYFRELEMDDPELVQAIVQRFQAIQAEALIQQQLRQGGFRGVGAQDQGAGAAPPEAMGGSPQQGAGQEGRQRGRAERLRA